MYSAARLLSKLSAVMLANCAGPKPYAPSSSAGPTEEYAPARLMRPEQVAAAAGPVPLVVTRQARMAVPVSAMYSQPVDVSMAAAVGATSCVLDVPEVNLPLGAPLVWQG